MVDYDELARRAFGQPCPAAIPSCTNHWGELTDAQKAEVTDLLKRLDAAIADAYENNVYIDEINTPPPRRSKPSDGSRT